MSEYPIKIRKAVPPGETASMPFQVMRAGRIVDVVGLPAGVIVVQAAFPRVRWNREETKTTLGEHLKTHPYDANAGAYCVFTVLNTGEKPVDVSGRAVVENEQGAAVEAKIFAFESDADDGDANAAEIPIRRGRGADLSSARNVRSAQSRENDARVEAIIDSAEMGDAVGMPPKRARGADVAVGGVRRPGPPPPISIANPIKKQNVLTKKQRKERLLAQAAAAAKTAASAKHGDTDRVVVLHVGHVEMLDLALTARAPLTNESRVEIAYAFSNAVVASSETPALAIGDVAVRFAVADFDRLLEALECHAEYALDDTDAMVRAISDALSLPSKLPADGVSSKKAESSPSIGEQGAFGDVKKESAPIIRATAKHPQDASGSSAQVSEITSLADRRSAHVIALDESSEGRDDVQDDGRPGNNDNHRPGVHPKSAANET